MKSSKRTKWSARELLLARQLQQINLCYSCVARVLNARFHDGTEVRNAASVRGALRHHYDVPPRTQRGNGIANMIGGKAG